MTALNADASANDSLLLVDTTSGRTAGEVIQVGTELMRVRFARTGRLGVDRGYQGTTRATHASGSTVSSGGVPDASVVAADLALASVGKTKLVGGFLKVALVAGAASATDATIAAIAVGDELVSVLSFTTAAAIATVADRTGEYAIKAGGLTKAAGTNETSNQLVVIYLDLT